LPSVFLAVVDGVVAAVRLCQFGFLFRADRADHRRADRVQPLAGDEADAAGGGMEQHGVALLDFEGAADEILDRHALQHHRRGGAVIDGIGQLHQAVPRHDAGLGIGAGRQVRIGDTVAGLEGGDAVAHRFDDTHALHADGRRILQRVGAHAVIDIDVVEAAGLLLQQHFARAGRRHVDVFVLQDFRAAGFVNADCLDHQARCSLKNETVRSLASLAAAAS